MKAPKTLLQAIQYFSDAENCRKFIISVRWMDGKVRCPVCGSDKVAYLEKSRLYYCNTKHPHQKFSLKVGTVIEDSPIGLDKWFPAMWLLANSKNGIDLLPENSARENWRFSVQVWRRDDLAAAEAVRMWEAFVAFHICIASCCPPEFIRCSVSQRTMRPFAVILLSPGCQCYPHIVQGAEPVRVQAFVA